MGLTIATFVVALVQQNAAGQTPAESSDRAIVIFVLAVGLMLLVGRLLGELMQRIGQPAVMGELLAGVVLGQSVFGWLLPSAHHFVFPDSPQQKNMIDAISQIGVLMLLMLTGMETDVALMRRMRRTALFTSLSGILLPFACGFLLGHFLPDSLLPAAGKRVATSLFLATALSISSVKIVAMVLMEVNFLSRNIGQMILASAILDDTLGWVIIAIIGGLVSQGTLNLKGAGIIFAGTAGFLAVAFTVGRRWVAHAIRWVNDYLTIEMPVITAILIIMFAMAAITDAIGVHTVLGAFVAGILIGQSPILTRHIQEQLRGLIIAFFMPVFFAVAGLSTNLSIFKRPALIELELLLIAIASFGKLVGCYAGGRIGGLNHHESAAIAIGMNARGSTEVIIATIGLSMGVLSGDIYTLIVTMAIATTMVTPPLLRWTLSRVEPGEEEKVRMEREVAEAREFVPQVERLLIAVDGSDSGKLASRVGGLFSGGRKVMTTVLEVGAKGGLKAELAGSAAEQPAEIVKASAESASEGTPGEPHEPSADDLVTAGKAKPAEVHAAILKEAEKGYDMLFLGLEKALNESSPGTSSSEVQQVVEGFKGLVALAVAKGRTSTRPAEGPLRILVPAIGTDYSRRAAEVAITIARASNSKVTALNVSGPPATMDLLRRRSNQFLKTGRAFVDDIKKLGDRAEVSVQAMVVTGRNQDVSILRHINKYKFDLVVLGVKARSVEGEGLFFGKSAAALVERSPCSLLMVIS